MRVGLSLLTVVPGISGGSETYARELARSLARIRTHEYVLLVPPLAPDAPLLREWAVVVTAPSLSVLLTAWEVPYQPTVPTRRRTFESTFTFDPAAVRTAAEVCVAAARASGVVPTSELSALGDTLAAEPTPSHGVDSLVMRAFDYLQHAPRVGP